MDPDWREPSLSNRVPRRAGTTLHFALQCAFGGAVVGLITVCGIALRWNLSTASLMYLFLVILSAHRYGFWQASVISIAAVLVQSYCFAPPAFSFYIADPQNGLAIFVFEVTALLVSRLSTREKTHASELERQQRSLGQLFAISRGALLLNPHCSPVEQMAELVLKECQVDAVAILDARTGAGNSEFKTAGRWPFAPDAMAEQISRGELYAVQADVHSGMPGLSYRTLVMSNAPIGALLVLCRDESSAAVNSLTMEALASLIALTFERYRAFHSERVSVAARQTEQLRTTVLDGLAHAFKTPLTIIRAASSGLLEMGHLDYMEQELTTLIDTQSMRLDELATRLLQTARVDGENILLEREIVSIGELVRQVAATVTRAWAERSDGRESPRVQVLIDSIHPAVEPLTAMADYDMLSATVKELLENAAKYSTEGSPILLRASRSHSEILVSVHNRGPVIRLEDRERIFERYYRCPDHRHSAPGTGIGLSMARNALEAHGGHIWVISGEREGTTFSFSLPRSLSRPILPLPTQRLDWQRTQKSEVR